MFNLNEVKYREAYIPNQYESVKIVLGSEEKIFDSTYVSAIVQNRRIVKFLKTAVKYKNERI